MNLPNKGRLAVATLALSAAGFIGIVSNEGYSDQAIIPIAGDRPTIGFGSTFHADGTPVKMGERITPQGAIRTSIAHIGKDELKLKRCVTGELSQAEYDILVDFAYWRGSAGACRSEVVANINKGDYVASCEAYLSLDSRRAAKRDCKVAANNCRGVWLRAQERHRKCMEAQ
ncbi:MAG TPA: lysozyme [Noviherbaspirillum sp.]|nr:lysozyme [Noviherbaspirillum sp.]